jgi:hypothetical protein
MCRGKLLKADYLAVLDSDMHDINTPALLIGVRGLVDVGIEADLPQPLE